MGKRGHHSSEPGFDVRELNPLVTIVAHTDNSVYRIVPLQSGDGRVLIAGGRYFPEPTEVKLTGSTYGGSVLRMGWIGIGMNIEIQPEGDPVVTSPVRSITVEYASQREGVH